ncbi:MAG: response regulator transcription factor [Lachnospiraceae bacterium]|nr:response regulator transcription factor [Lachnospiraceae bacterium]
MTDIYYIEDDASIAQSVKEYLEQYDFRVTVYDTIAGARAAIGKMCPQLVLLDWNMPDGQGDRLCRFIRSEWSELPIIFLTVKDDAKDIVAGFKDGADDYVVKPFELTVLHSRILALLRRAGQTGQARLRCDDIILDQEKLSVYLGKEELTLSLPEYQLLQLLMENKGKTVMRGQILEHVWDSNGNYVNDNTLTVTMKRLREKLHHPACIKTIRSFGYRMEDTL